GRAVVLTELGRPSDAAPLVDEVLALPFNYAALVELAWALTDLGRGEDLMRRADEIELTPWREAALAIAAGRAEAAADTLADMGDVADEAYARLRSGREDQVRRALDFYRAVGATRYIREGDALLAQDAPGKSAASGEV